AAARSTNNSMPHHRFAASMSPRRAPCRPGWGFAATLGYDPVMRCAWLLLPLLSLGCIDTDAAVFVEARIDGAAARVEQSALATGLSGSFRIHFHLGPRASGPSEVALTGFFVTD